MTPSADEPGDPRAQALSALCDGEADRAEADRCFEAWRDDPAARARWHSYQWIGDAMRSEDLASPSQHDQDFLMALRARLAEEPVVLAPARLEPMAMPAGLSMPQSAAAGARRGRWATPAAVAAGFVVVAGALVVMRQGAPEPNTDAPQLVRLDPADVRNAPSLSGPVLPASGPGGGMLRNPELDRYLDAHRQFSQGPALASPGGVRQVAVTPDGR